MKFGAVTHAVGHHMPLEQTLATIKEIGFDSVLLLTSRSGEAVQADGTCRSAFPDILKSRPEHMRRAIDNAGLELGAVHFAGRLAVESEQDVETGIQNLREYAAYTLELGCQYLTLPVPGCGHMHMPVEQKAPQIRRLARIMNDTAEAFFHEALRVACDVHQSAWVEGVDDCRLLLDSMPSPHAGILLNIGHLTTVQAYGWLLVEEYPQRIPVVGWKDHSLAKDRPRVMWSIELGTGHSPFEIYIRHFKQHPVERIHLINCEDVPDDARVSALRRSLAYLRELWEETDAST